MAFDREAAGESGGPDAAARSLARDARPRVGLAGLRPQTLEAACAAVAAEGCEAVACRQADRLFALLAAGALDLVLADSDALGIGPGELTRRIKAVAPQTMALVLSRDGAAAAPVQAMRAGAYDYLQEPVSPEELRERLRYALGARRLGLAIRQRSLQLAFLSRLSGTFGASLDLHHVLRTAVGELRALADFDLALAVLRAGSSGAAAVVALTPDAGAVELARDRVPIERSVLARCPGDGQPRLLTELDGAALSPDLAPLRQKGVRAILILPLLSRREAVGAIVLASRRADAFAGADLDLLRHGAEHLASAVVNALLYEEVKALSARLVDDVRARTREAIEVREYLESLLEMAGDAIITVDPERRITTWNDGARQMLGYARDEARGTDLCRLASGEGASEQLARIIHASLAGQTASNVETLWQRKDGREVSVSLTASPIPGGAAQRGGVLVIARDVTERKRLQEELFHSDKLASIGQLAAGVAHQINNPLGAISGRAQMLLRLSSPPDADFLREQLGKIRADCARIADTINDLLGFARKTETVKQPTDVHAVLEETLEMVAHGLPAAGVRIERRYTERLPPLLASPNHLRQLFANLVTNAFDAMAAGGTLTIATSLLPATPDRPEKLLEVSLADTGVGIDPEDIPRIFEPFFTTKPPGQGTGLGLAVAHRIAQLHNAHISVESNPGSGTTFTIQFPIQ